MVGEARSFKKTRNCLNKVANKVSVQYNNDNKYYGNKEKTRRKEKKLHIYLDISEYFLVFPDIKTSSLILFVYDRSIP